MTNNQIIEYYDKAEIAYRDGWHLDSCLSMHYGFWDKGVNSLKKALIKEIEVLAEFLNLSPEDYVLDAGCGVGGSSIHLASHFDCKVHGISLSKNQVEQAINASQSRGLDSLLKFSVRDFHETGFESETFSVAWFVESFCHSTDTPLLLNEMNRVLKLKGRIIIADGFATKESLNEKEKQIMNNWLNNWAIDKLETVESIRNQLRESGFQNIQIQDYTKLIRNSSILMHFYGQSAILHGNLRKIIGKPFINQVAVKNSIAAKYQYIALKNHLWEYKVITAEKVN